MRGRYGSMRNPIVEVDGVEIDGVVSVEIVAEQSNVSTFANWDSMPAITSWRYKLEVRDAGDNGIEKTSIEGYLRSELEHRLETRLEDGEPVEVHIICLFVSTDSARVLAQRAKDSEAANLRRWAILWRRWFLEQRPGAHRWRYAHGLMSDPHSSNAECLDCGEAVCILCDDDYDQWLGCDGGDS